MAFSGLFPFREMRGSGDLGFFPALTFQDTKCSFTSSIRNMGAGGPSLWQGMRGRLGHVLPVALPDFF